jgi:16S rRNA (adenine1518-N6/adenine1519-N6)-dimethyltransferase
VTHSHRRLRALLDASGLAPRRDLGQNFVGDPNTVRRIAALARVGPDDSVVEIGAGLGSLTLALAETGAAVTAIEVDRRIAAVLRAVVDDAMSETAGHPPPLPAPRIEIVEGDATTLDWDALLAGNDHWVLVANLPYNVATPLVCDVLDHVPVVERMLVMVQREVAERFTASPGTKQYGAVTVKIRYWASARVVGTVPPSAFVPRPNVESALVEIVRRDPPTTPPERVFPLVRAGFAHRRKMLRGVLAGTVTPEQFATAGVRPEARAEELDVDDWCRLAETAAGGDGPA